MTKNTSFMPYFRLFKGTVVCLLLFFSLGAQNPEENASFTQPFFKGCVELPNLSIEKRNCSDLALARYLSNSISYPLLAVENNIQGTVVVSFDVDERGMVQDAKVEHDIGGGCGQAALSIVTSMPPWEPALHAGKPRKTRMTIPIRFELENGKSNNATGAFSLRWGAATGNDISKKELKKLFLEPVRVLDPYGNQVLITDLSVVREKGRKSTNYRTNGNVLDKKMQKLVQHTSVGDIFRLSAAIQQGAGFLTVEEAYRIVK